MKRNLIYYICPFKVNDEWEKNVRTLSKYLKVFNNRVIVAIAEGEGLETSKNVKKKLAIKDIEYITVENDLVLREVNPFMRMLREVRSTDPEEFTFYAHAKGVTPGYSGEKLKNVQIWRNVMYYFCLNDVSAIDIILAKYACCGCFKRAWPCAPWVPEPWHFSGTFFWFNHQKLFSKPNWNEIGRNTAYAVEGYLANYFDEESAYNLFNDDTEKYSVDSPILYNEKKWKRILAPHNLNMSDFSD